MRIALLLLMLQVASCLVGDPLCLHCHAGEPAVEGESSREAKLQAVQSVPFHRLSQNTGELLRDVLDNPSFFRRMPAQEIECDPQMFTFLVRRPEVMVNIWELMGITQVSTQRTSPFSFLANDGVGTTAKCDLVYGDRHLHIYYGTGNYDGSMTPRKMSGRCVCILQTRDSTDRAGVPTIQGTMDIFLKLDNLGADLITRTLGPFVGKTADYNFVETAQFMSQISQICTHNPAAAQGLAMQLNRVDSAVREEFASIAARIAANEAEPVAFPTDAEVDHDAARPSLTADTAQVHSRPSQWTSRQLAAQPAAEAPAPAPTGEAGSPLLQLADEVRQSQMTGRPSAIRPQKPNIYMRR